jgi:hypothetical protein
LDDKVLIFGITQYVKALNGLQKKLDDGSGDIKIVLIACAGAQMHLKSGISIIQKQEFGGDSILVFNPPSSPTIEIGNMRKTFLSLEVQAASFAAAYSAQLLRPLAIPDKFYTISESRDSLLDIQSSIYVSHQTGNEPCPALGLCPPFPPYPEIICESRSNLFVNPMQKQTTEHLLQRWSITFDKYLISSASNMPTADLSAAIVLKVQHRSASIRVATAFDTDQTAFDSYKSVFIEIVTLSQSLINTHNRQGSRKHVVAFEMGVVEALYYTGCRCRDPVIRRQAIALLGQTGREGIWDGPAMKPVVEWIVALEEEGLEVGGVVEESRRVHEIRVRMDRSGRMSKVNVSRKNAGGIWEFLDDEVAW